MIRQLLANFVFFPNLLMSFSISELLVAALLLVEFAVVGLVLLKLLFSAAFGFVDFSIFMQFIVMGSGR